MEEKKGIRIIFHSPSVVFLPSRTHPIGKHSRIYFPVSPRTCMTFFREENRHGIPGRAVPDSPRYPLAGLLCPGQYCATGACHRIAACAPWRGCIVQRTWENARDLAPGMKLSFINPAHARAHGSLFHVPSPLPVTFRMQRAFPPGETREERERTPGLKRSPTRLSMRPLPSGGLPSIFPPGGVVRKTSTYSLTIDQSRNCRTPPARGDRQSFLTNPAGFSPRAGADPLSHHRPRTLPISPIQPPIRASDHQNFNFCAKTSKRFLFNDRNT